MQHAFHEGMSFTTRTVTSSPAELRDRMTVAAAATSTYMDGSIAHDLHDDLISLADAFDDALDDVFDH